MKTLALVLTLGLSWTAPLQAATINSLRDGLWYCDFPSGSCSFDAATPGNQDTVRVQHNVTYWGQGTTTPSPLLTEILGLELTASGFLGIYEGRTLRAIGQSRLEGGEMNGVINGGGFFENYGTVLVPADAQPRIIGTRVVNRSLWQVASGAKLLVSVGSGSEFANSTGPGGYAVFELQGTATAEINALFHNDGILRKTAAGTARLLGTWRNDVDGAGGGSIEIEQGELLITDSDEAGHVDGRVDAVGSELHIASAALLRVANGGQYRLLSEDSFERRHTLEGGGKFVLDTGGEIYSDGGSGIIAVFPFAPGQFEMRGGVLNAQQVRNEGTIELTGPDVKVIRGPLNEGLIRLANEQTVVIHSSLTNTATGTVEFGDGASLDGSQSIINSGLVVKRGGAGTSIIHGNAYNPLSPGVLAVEQGVLVRRSGFDAVDGTVRVMQGTTYRRLNSIDELGIEEYRPGSVLTGAGTLETGFFYLGGSLEPGDQGIGTLTVQGGIHMQSSGQFRFEIAGAGAAQIDHLRVDYFAATTAQGQVVARFINSFHPRQGQAFPLISTDIPPNAALNLSFEGLHPGFSGHLDYLDGVITLVADSDGLNLSTAFRDGFED